MNSFVGAVALIRRDGEGGSEWYAKPHPARGCLALPEAVKLDGETYRESLLREIAWDAGLDGTRDFVASSAPRAHVQFLDGREGDPAAVLWVVEFYLVELFRRGRAKLADDAAAVWLKSADLRAGHAGGVPLCPHQRTLLARADLLDEHTLQG